MVRKALHTFLEKPLFFLLIALPQSLGDLIEVGIASETTPNAWAVAFLLPYLLVTSLFTVAGTYLLVQTVESGQKLSISKITLSLASRIGIFIPVSLVTGLTVLLGMSLILPAFYLMAAYLFVPIILVSAPKKPWSVYLYESKLIARQAWGRAILIVSAVMGTMLAIEFGFDLVNPRSHGWSKAMVITAKLALLCLSSSLTSILTCHLFSVLTEKGALFNKTASKEIYPSNPD